MSDLNASLTHLHDTLALPTDRSTKAEILKSLADARRALAEVQAQAILAKTTAEDSVAAQRMALADALEPYDKGDDADKEMPDEIGRVVHSLVVNGAFAGVEVKITGRFWRINVPTAEDVEEWLIRAWAENPPCQTMHTPMEVFGVEVTEIAPALVNPDRDFWDTERPGLDGPL